MLGKYPPCLDPTTGSRQWPLMDNGSLSHGTTRATALGREQSFSTLYCHRTRRVWPLLSKTLDLTEHAAVAHKSGITES